jgi:signal transduction histidine kinase
MFTPKDSEQPEKLGLIKEDWHLFPLLEQVGAISSLCVDEEGRIESPVDSFCSFFGITCDRSAIRSMEQLLSPDDYQLLCAVLTNLPAALCPSPMQMRLTLPGEKDRFDIDCILLVARAQVSIPYTQINRENGLIISTEIRSKSLFSIFFIAKYPSIIISPFEYRQHKLLALGALSAGVAHDLNNLFTGMASYTTLVQQKTVDPQAENYLSLIERIVDRSSKLSSSILSYIAEDHKPAEPINPLSCIRDIVQMAGRTFSEEIELKIRLPKKHFPVLIKWSDLSQIVLNLVINARDAIDGQGEITVEAFYDPKDKPKGLIIRVSDSGRGIPIEIESLVFNPFFTTKKEKSGVGLGLAIVKELVEKSGGTIEFSSKPGKTVFEVRFPITKRPIESESIANVSGGGERIWIWASLCNQCVPLKDLCESKGYEVEVVHPPIDPSCPADLTIFDVNQYFGKIEAQVVDLRREFPDMRIIICSGVVPPKGSNTDPFVSYVQKPFHPNVLWKTIRDLLDKQ